MTRLDPVLGERIARQGFVDRPATTVAGAAALGCGLQAQDPVAGRLGVRARATGLCDADVLHAMDVERTVVRTSLMRATIHLVATEDVRWLTALLGPGIARSFAKRWRDLGLTEPVLQRCAAVLADVLSAEPMTRSEAMTALVEHGVPVDTTDPIAATHVLLHATTLGLACRGPDRGREPTFVHLDRWAPGAAAGPRGDDALADLARRYFRAFSPATARDFTTWSKLPSGRPIELIRDELTPVEVHGRPGYRLGTVEPQRGVRLLPAFDNYLLGYVHRDEMISDARRAEVYFGGIIRPTVVVDGRIVGRWVLTRATGGASVTVLPFETFAAATQRAIAREVDEIVAFLGAR